MAIGLAIRLAFLLVTGPLIEMDTPSYLSVAANLRRTGSFCEVDAITGQMGPYAFRMPLFHVLAACLIGLFGPAIGWPLALVNLVLATAVVALTIRIATAVAGPTSGLIAGSLMALSPTAIVNTPALLTDTLFGFAMALTTLAGIRALTDPGPLRVALWGFMTGATSMVRPVLKYFWLVAPALLAAVVRPIGRSVRLSAVFVLASGLVLGTWAARNLSQLGFFGLELNTGVNTVWSTIDLVERSTPQERAADPVFAQVRDLAAGQPDALVAMYAVQRRMGLSPVEIDRHFYRLGLEVVRRHPVAFSGRFVRNALNVLTGPASVQEIAWRTGATGADVRLPLRELAAKRLLGPLSVNLVTRALCLVVLVVLPLGGAVSLLADRSTRGLALLLTVTVAYHVVLTSAVAGSDRYRLAIEPILFTLAAAAARPRVKAGSMEVEP